MLYNIKIGRRGKLAILGIIILVVFVLGAMSAKNIILPGQNKVNISGVKVNDFNKMAVEKNNEGDVVFNQSQGFDIAHLSNGSFIISITASPFDTNRKLAEEAFLKNLEITQDEACKLPVQITTPAFANPSQAGTIYKLSFCE